ncbi:MAG: DNA-3-methyladenine glycosylase family protein [Limisphaerales bacterium]
MPAERYDLDATLNSGQAFRWRRSGQIWVGVIHGHWVSLESARDSILARTTEPISEWGWLVEYLQCELNLDDILRSFPPDEPMRNAVAACQGLRLLRQQPWECLVSFLLSSTKQIVQIQQIVALLCQSFGEPIVSPPHGPVSRAFPSPDRLARASEDELRACKMGFRAPYVLAAARVVEDGSLDLEALRQLPAESARAQLMRLRGVGRKIADCVLLFAYGFQAAFPVDVWVMRALRQLYFPRRRVSLERLHRFSAAHFGPYAGYAQQYLFHYARTKLTIAREPK